MQTTKFKIKLDPVIYCSCEHGLSHGRQNIFSLRYFLIITEPNKLCIRPINLLKPICYVMHHQFNNQQLYALPTLYLSVLYLSEEKQRLVPLIA